ncbi:odorant receptor 42b-like [Diachasmimorpha longicaudata]|uniref:odorant receptor 42b-like n=1 Tax=Diachasmimorpha longicaudata TaxID=58733 RepID=UPI0030B90810
MAGSEMAQVPHHPPTYVTFNLKYLTLSGLWNPYNDYRKWFYNIYCGMIAFLVVIIRTLGYMSHAWSVHDDFVRLTLSGFLAFAFTCGCLKNINLLWRRSDINFIATTLQWETSLPCSKETALYRDEMVPQTIKLSKLFTIIWILDALFCEMFFYLECLDENRRTLNDVLIGYTCLRSFVQTWNFWILLVTDYLMFTVVTFTVLANDCLVMSLTFHISTQLKILNFRLRKSCRSYVDSAASEISENGKPNIFYCPQTDVGTVRSAANQELIYCIQHYQQIVRMVDVMQSVYGIILFPQLVSSVVMISLTGIHLFVTKTVSLSNPIPAGQTILALLSILFQLVAYCWGGNTIISESDLVSSATYKSNWYKADKEFQTNMLIFAAMTQNPLSLSAFGLFELSLPTLKNVLVKSYSAMALVKRANE